MFSYGHYLCDQIKATLKPILVIGGPILGNLNLGVLRLSHLSSKMGRIVM